jgi:hypothetical protein
MQANLLASELRDQLQRANRMFRDAVGAFEPDEWRRANTLYRCPAALALHVVETIEFYFSGKSGREFPWGHRFAVDWETEQLDRLPSPESLLAYCDEAEAELDEWLESTDLGAESPYPWTGDTAAGLAIYVARHTQHHVSELALELTRLGRKAPDWH